MCVCVGGGGGGGGGMRGKREEGPRVPPVGLPPLRPALDAHVPLHHRQHPIPAVQHRVPRLQVLQYPSVGRRQADLPAARPSIAPSDITSHVCAPDISARTSLSQNLRWQPVVKIAVLGTAENDFSTGWLCRPVHSSIRLFRRRALAVWLTIDIWSARRGTWQPDLRADAKRFHLHFHTAACRTDCQVVKREGPGKPCTSGTGNTAQPKFGSLMHTCSPSCARSL